MCDVRNHWICKSSVKCIEDDRSFRNNKVVSRGWQYPVCVDARVPVFWTEPLSESICARCRPRCSSLCAHAVYVCVFGGCFWPFSASVCASVCVSSRQRHDRRERWFSLAVVVSESAREPTGSKWYSLVLNARVGRPALLQPLVSCYIMTWRWRGTTLLQKEEREIEEEEEEEEM